MAPLSPNMLLGVFDFILDSWMSSALNYPGLLESLFFFLVDNFTE
jgi:hypothetical protein